MASSGRMVGNPEIANSGLECCSVSNNWQLVGAVRKVEFKLLHLLGRNK
jgi:hypothetical protein